jgi:hypothetical protein
MGVNNFQTFNGEGSHVLVEDIAMIRDGDVNKLAYRIAREYSR